MARGAYLGSDLPEEQLRAPAIRAPGNTDLQELPGSPEMPPSEAASAADGPMSVILERATRYMGLAPEEISTMDDTSLSKLMDDLLAGYPDDAELAQAIEAVRGPMSAETDAAPAPIPPDAGSAAGPTASPMQFRPDRPY